MNNEEDIQKMIALMEQSVELQKQAGDQITVWDWYAGHALGGIMASMPNLSGQRAAEYVLDAVTAVMKTRPKT